MVVINAANLLCWSYDAFLNFPVTVCIKLLAVYYPLMISGIATFFTEYHAVVGCL
jgi:hypothetical protein